jgi:phenylpyruvate tautomerase
MFSFPLGAIKLFGQLAWRFHVRRSAFWREAELVDSANRQDALFGASLRPELITPSPDFAKATSRKPERRTPNVERRPVRRSFLKFQTTGRSRNAERYSSRSLGSSRYVARMPYLSIQTNSSLSDHEQTKLLDAASKIVASGLNKPESYVMVSFVHTQQMKFAGEDSPSAFLHLSSIGVIGVPESQRNPLISALTRLVAETFKIKPDRIYVVLEDVQAKLWGWNGAAFG